jgi:hypothetical protein
MSSNEPACASGSPRAESSTVTSSIAPSRTIASAPSLSARDLIVMAGRP